MSVHSNRSEGDQYSLGDADVLTKYRMGAEIANKALQSVMDACKEGVDIAELCKLGDGIILAETGKVYNKKVKKEVDEKEKKSDKEKDRKSDEKKMDKGIGFPTCVSVNEIAGHFSPLPAESRLIKSGDVVKIDLGVQIDGLIAQVAHTVVVCAPGELITDRRADVVKAAYTAAEAVARMMQPGKKNSEITKMLQTAADQFKCQPVAGVLSHEIKRNVICGERVIISKENANDEQRVDEFVLATNQAYVIDVMMSTGEGKTRETECRHTVYKRCPDAVYILKTAKGRQFIGEVGKRFPFLPFSLRNIEDEQCAKIGVSEAKRHALLEEFPVMAEKNNEFIAQFKFTVLLLPGGTKKITGLTMTQDAALASTHTVVDETLMKLLSQSVAPRKKRNNKKKDGEKEDGEEKKEE